MTKKIQSKMKEVRAKVSEKKYKEFKKKLIEDSSSTVKFVNQKIDQYLKY